MGSAVREGGLRMTDESLTLGLIKDILSTKDGTKIVERMKTAMAEYETREYKEKAAEAEIRELLIETLERITTGVPDLGKYIEWFMSEIDFKTVTKKILEIEGLLMTDDRKKTPKFRLGKTVITSGVAGMIDEDPEFEQGVMNSINGHHSGDWGEICDGDKELNDEALKEEMAGKPSDRLMSAFTVKGTKIWIITECDRSVTTVLLPEEY
jgi:hypothetical protein